MVVVHGPFTGVAGIFVRYKGNNRVNFFTGGGRFLNSFGTQGEGPGQFNECTGIVVDGQQRIIISGIISTASLVSLTRWLPTPSYNGLALQALFVAAAGLLLADKKVYRASVAGSVLIGIGGWLAFMAKPTTAAGSTPIAL